MFGVKTYRAPVMNQFGCRDGRADNAQALKACDPLGRVGSNPTPDAFSTSYLLTIFGKHFASHV